MSQTTSPAKPKTKSGAAPVEASATPNPLGVETSNETPSTGTPPDTIIKQETSNLEIIPPAATLTKEQSEELGKQEAIIHKGVETFYEVGVAFATIRDNGLFNPPYATFAMYLKERWGYTRQRGNQMIQAADMITAMSTRVDPKLLPTSERVARELLRVSGDNRAKVLELAHQKANGRLTAESIALAKKEVEPLQKKKKGERKKPTIKPEAAIKAAQLVEDFLQSTAVASLTEHQRVGLAANINSILDIASDLKLIEAS